MSKISLGSDNHSGIHPLILQSIAEANVGHSAAYGTDEWTEKANHLFKDVFGFDSETFFVFNGTAANVLAISSLIESHEAVITSSVSHLHLDECAAPEHIIGCKVHLCESDDGKITPDQIREFLVRGGDQHYAQPKLVSITLPTEYGTCYSYEELVALRKFTREHNLYLHIDGARLIYAAHYLKKELIDLTGRLGVDAVSFGGTKNGLLFGEAVILYNKEAQKKFKFIRKQNMQLPSKMRFLAVSFQRFLEPPGLWREIAGHGHRLAKYLEDGLVNIPEVKVTQPVQANSVFAIIPRHWHKPLRDQCFFYVWDEKKFEMRWMISYDVSQKDIDAFLETMRNMGSKHEL